MTHPFPISLYPFGVVATEMCSPPWQARHMELDSFRARLDRASAQIGKSLLLCRLLDLPDSGWDGSALAASLAAGLRRSLRKEGMDIFYSRSFKVENAKFKGDSKKHVDVVRSICAQRTKGAFVSFQSAASACLKAPPFPCLL